MTGRGIDILNNSQNKVQEHKPPGSVKYNMNLNEESNQNVFSLFFLLLIIIIIIIVLSMIMLIPWERQSVSLVNRNKGKA